MNIIYIDQIPHGTNLETWPQLPIDKNDNYGWAKYHQAVKEARSQCIPIAESDQNIVRAHIAMKYFDRDSAIWEPVDFTIYSDTGIEMELKEQWNLKGQNDWYGDEDKRFHFHHPDDCEYRTVLKLKSEVKETTECTGEWACQCPKCLRASKVLKSLGEKPESVKELLVRELATCEKTLKESGPDLYVEGKQFAFERVHDHIIYVLDKIVSVEEQPTEKGERKIGDLTKEEQEKYFEQHFSPLIRYGYNTAISDIIEWVADHENDYLSLMNQLTILMESKKQVDWDKLKIEVERVVPVSEEESQEVTDKEIEQIAYAIDDKFESTFIPAVQRWRFGRVLAKQFRLTRKPQ